MSDIHYKLTDISQFADYLINNEMCEKITCRNFDKNNSHYTIIYYDKSQLSTDNYNSIGLLRSVILNEDKKICCFSPPKTIPFTDFQEKYPKDDNIIIEEFVEGTMINLFWDKHSSNWELSTRRTIGANNGFSFVTQKSKPNFTFRDLFNDIINKIGFNLDMLDINYCYSFVIQHPANRIVLPIEKPSIYLIAVYSIQDDYTIQAISLDNYKEDEIWKNCGISFPEIYNFTWDKYEDLQLWFGGATTPSKITGAIIRNTITNQICKIRNPNYENIRALRNNQPNPQYNYLQLRQTNKVSEYLKFFPEDKNIFYKMRLDIHAFTQELYGNYISCYIKKTKPLKEYSEYFRTHMYHLHQQFITKLKPENKYITKAIVIEYVNNLDPKLQMYSLNYKKNKSKNTKNEEIIYDIHDIQSTITSDDNMETEVSVEVTN